MSTNGLRVAPMAETNSVVWLRRFLALDAAVTGVNGLAYLLASGPVGQLLGVDGTLLLGVGVFLTLYGAGVGYLAGHSRPAAPAVQAVIATNALWVVISVVALAVWLGDLHVAGAVWIPMQAVVVGGFALLQYLALRQVRAGTSR
ncbi:hypothetical protein [Micromonospora sp. NBRC 101691]|uniref:hypothetical protein n=1 Tax=Micromonospora sp. NBRC 101691 TaxID=3032198 RepID=UPI0024A244EA|nr:hypothetical protein [Micromonospora sp. NBRC 101691]GLY23870.1 hypothetical protein Misp04_36020 [Micromonospora sp. NBRC 101691]